MKRFLDRNLSGNDRLYTNPAYINSVDTNFNDLDDTTQHIPKKNRSATESKHTKVSTSSDSPPTIFPDPQQLVQLATGKLYTFIFGSCFNNKVNFLDAQQEPHEYTLFSPSQHILSARNNSSCNTGHHPESFGTRSDDDGIVANEILVKPLSDKFIPADADTGRYSCELDSEKCDTSIRKKLENHDDNDDEQDECYLDSTGSTCSTLDIPNQDESEHKNNDTMDFMNAVQSKANQITFINTNPKSPSPTTTTRNQENTIIRATLPFGTPIKHDKRSSYKHGSPHPFHMFKQSSSSWVTTPNSLIQTSLENRHSELIGSPIHVQPLLMPFLPQLPKPNVAILKENGQSDSHLNIKFTLLLNTTNQKCTITCPKLWTVYELFTLPESMLCVNPHGNSNNSRIFPNNVAKIGFLPHNETFPKTYIKIGHHIKTVKLIHVFTQQNQNGKSFQAPHDFDNQTTTVVELLDRISGKRPNPETPVTIRIRWNTY